MMGRCFAPSLCALACASSVWAANLLQNPGFERDRNRDGIPDGWARVYNEKLSGPCRLVDDAHEGRRAVQFETEEWNYLRPNHLAQEVKLPKGAEFACLSVYAKGRGLVSLCVRFLTDGRPVEEKTIDMGFGPEKIPAEVRNDFALELDYSRYEALYEIPKGANGVHVLLGNTAGLLDRLNVWGRCTLDDASFAVGTRKELGKLAADGPMESMPLAVSGPLKNIAPFSRIRLEPPSFDARALTDGDVKSAAAFYPGPERGGIVRFLFPKAAPVKMLKLYLNGAAGSYSLRGDKDSDGVFETPILRTEGLAGLSGWKTHVLPGDAFQAIQVQALSGTEGLWGFRQTNPFLTEVEIHVPADALTDAELKDWRANTYDYPLAGGFAAIEAKPEPLPLQKGKGRFRKMVCADLWVWGIDYKKDVKKGTWTKEKLRANAGFQDSAKIAREMGCDTIFVDLTNSTCWDLMPWPSKVCNGVEDNILKALVDALHEEGFKVVTEVLHNFTPFEPIKWHYPCEETSRYPAMKQFPSILYGGHVRDNWLKVYEEMVECGADGVCLGSDEFYYRGHFLRTLPENDAQRQFYEKTHGRPPYGGCPAREADTLDYRWWVRDTEEGLAGLFTYWNAELKKKYPNLYTCTVFMQPVQRSNLYGEGVPFDLVGQKSGVDEIGGDYYEPWGIRMLSASNGWRKVSHLFWGWFEAKDAPINLYARPLWMLMYGGGSANYWRFYQLKESGHWKSVQKGYAMVDDLEALGVWDARPPHDIAVLSSRESWDWWQVRSYYGPLPKPTADRAIEAMRGWFADELVNDRILIKNGYPYDWYFADNPKHLEQLDGYKVILLPFAYSISDAAAAKIKEAARKGAKVILFGTLGETDEWGQPRATPALPLVPTLRVGTSQPDAPASTGIFRDLVDSGQATLLSEDLLEAGSDDRFQAKALALIDGALGDKHPFKMNRYGKHIDATLLAKGERERFVFLINWEEKPATVDLSVGVPEGNYRVLMRDDLQWHKVTVGGRDIFTRAMLKGLRRLVPAQKAEVYYVSPAGK